MDRVKGKEGLVKDPSSNTVLNVNQSQYKNYCNVRNKLKRSIKREEELEDRLEKMEALISELIKERESE